MLISNQGIYRCNLIREDGLTELLCDQPPKKFVDDKMERGIDKNGVSQILTQGEVLHHDAIQVRQGSPTVYQWITRSMREPLPSNFVDMH